MNLICKEKGEISKEAAVTHFNQDEKMFGTV